MENSTSATTDVDIVFPPQPKLSDFFLDGFLYRDEFNTATVAWAAVCKLLMEKAT